MRHKGKMSILTSIANNKKQSSLGQGLSSRWFERFVLVYDLWVFLIFLAPVLMRLGWNGAGQAVFFIYFIFLIPIHGAILLFAG